MVVSRGSDSGYILAKVPVSAIQSVAERTEVTEVSSGVVAYMDPLVQTYVTYHKAGNGATEKLLVHLEVPFTYDSYFLGPAKGLEAGTANVAKLRAYLSGQAGVVIAQNDGNGITARVPLVLLQELSEMPFVDAVMVNGPSVPGLTATQNAKVVHMDLAEIMAAQVAGTTLSSDANSVNNRIVEVVDGKARIAIEIAGADSAAERTNGQEIIDFLAGRGGSGELANDSLIGAFVRGVAPLSGLVPLVKLTEVDRIYIEPPGAGPIPPMNGPEQLDYNPRSAEFADDFQDGQQAVSAATSAGRERHGVKAWHDAGITGAGVKVGVIDTEFEDFSSLMGSELPAQTKLHVRCYIGNWAPTVAHAQASNAYSSGPIYPARPTQ